MISACQACLLFKVFAGCLLYNLTSPHRSQYRSWFPWQPISLLRLKKATYWQTTCLSSSFTSLLAFCVDTHKPWPRPASLMHKIFSLNLFLQRLMPVYCLYQGTQQIAGSDGSWRVRRLVYKDKERNRVLINFLLQFTRPADTCEIALVTVMSLQKRCYITNMICCTTENLIYGMQQSYLMA